MLTGKAVYRHMLFGIWHISDRLGEEVMIEFGRHFGFVRLRALVAVRQKV